MKKYTKKLSCGIATMLLAITMFFSACTISCNGPTSSDGNSSSDSTTNSTDNTSTDGGSTGTDDGSTGGSTGTDGSSGDSQSSDDSGSSSGDVTVTNVTLSYTVLNLNTGDSSAISATVTTRDGSEYTGGVTWSSSDDAVATVTGSGASATVNALSAGTATITATAGGIGAECKVTVTQIVLDGLQTAGAYSESIYATWETTNVTNVTAYYKESSSSAWIAADKNLIRMSGGAGRIDIVGLKAGSYDIKVMDDGEATATNIAVNAYDRSGYAHYNTAGYDGGVGAYNDDGTLKDGALVIYLTEENKNNVTDYCYTYSAADGTYTKTDISDYLVCSDGTAVCGIGEILNNRRYSGTDRHGVGIAKLCDIYGAVTVRIIGKVEADVNSDGTSTITGLTDYNSTGNGGSSGDNGRMARMVNAHDLTIEGIGTDACIYGWGIHFISNDVLGSYQSVGSGAGKSFEVRNITFESYPEDAIGMEGIQGLKYDSTGSVTSGDSSADADLLSPVEYCWIHNNSFLPGYCANPAESDKAEGDGSCDFKRGQYYTLSYNYFEYCHKTNLIGSSDTSLQYNISMHHNYWYNCGSRIPLARRANIHFYNNYIYGNAADSSASLSYVHSARANSYIYAENNYYEGCKNVAQVVSGGVIKSYGNTYFGCSDDDYSTQATSRTQAVDNSCAFTYKNIDYSSFDTDGSLFYYDGTAEASSCYLTNAVTARKEAITGAGVNSDAEDKATDINEVTPSSSVIVGSDGLTVDLTKVSKGSSTVSGVEFTNITGVSGGTIKGKGQLATFTLSSEAELTVSAAASDEDTQGELIGADGTVYANKFTDLTIVLQAGTYVIASGKIDKELTINSLSFADTAASSAARVQAATAAIQALCGYTSDTVAADLDTFEGLVTAAQTAYSALTASELAAFDTALTAALDTAVSLLNEAKADVVEAYIAAIGTVTQDSGTAITAARTAYDALTDAQKALVTNYSALTAAETAYADYAVTDVINAIAALTDVSAIDISVRTALETAVAQYTAAQAAYDGLTAEQQANVTNSGVLSGLADLEEMYVIYDFTDLLDGMDETNITLSDSADVTALTTCYNALTNEQGAYYAQFNALLTGNLASYVTKYNAIIEAYGALSAQTMVITFADSTAATYYTNYGNVTASESLSSNKTSITYDGVEYTKGLKLNSSGYITITATASMDITLYFSTDNSGNKVAIGDGEYTIGTDGIVTATISAGSITIKRSSGESCLYVAVLSPRRIN